MVESEESGVSGKEETSGEEVDEVESNESCRDCLIDIAIASSDGSLTKEALYDIYERHHLEALMALSGDGDGSDLEPELVDALFEDLIDLDAIDKELST